MRLVLSVCGLSLALAVTVAACGGGDGESIDSASPEPPPAAAEASGETGGAEGTAPEPGGDAPTETAATSEATDPPAEGGLYGELVTCELETVPSQVPLDGGIVHVDRLPDGFVYNSTPASQGPHGDDWLRWGIYEEPVPELNVVHNLEHGGITVQYGPEVPDESVAAVAAWYLEDPNAVLVAPYEGLGADIALAAWTVDDIDQGADAVYRSSEGNVLRCTGFDERAFSEFREGFRGRAPERVPIDQMPPGS